MTGFCGNRPQKRLEEGCSMVPQNCHPDRSAAQRRDLLFFI
jgi:hypothetical protein